MNMWVVLAQSQSVCAQYRIKGHNSERYKKDAKCSNCGGSFLQLHQIKGGGGYHVDRQSIFNNAIKLFKASKLAVVGKSFYCCSIKWNDIVCQFNGGHSCTCWLKSAPK